MFKSSSDFFYLVTFLFFVCFTLIKAFLKWLGVIKKNEDGVYSPTNRKIDKFRKVKEKYTRDYNHSFQVGKEIQRFNPHFSETFFTTWVQTMFLRYAFLVSSNDKNRLNQFEATHLLNTDNNNHTKILDLYNRYEDMQINFVDLFEYIHKEEIDTLTLKLSLTGIGDRKKNSKDAIKEQFTDIYTLVFQKKNEKDVKNYDYKSNCPNCGAPTEIVTYGVCDHCQELVSIYDNVWKIVDISIEE